MPRVLPDEDVWDPWPVQGEDGSPTVVAGRERWMALSAPATGHPEARHDLARLRLLSRTATAGRTWDMCSPTTPRLAAANGQGGRCVVRPARYRSSTRPSVHNSAYYLFFSTQRYAFHPAGCAPTGLYSFTAPSMSGPFTPLNGSGLWSGTRLPSQTRRTRGRSC
jgi:hypothetical protein